METKEITREMINDKAQDIVKQEVYGCVSLLVEFALSNGDNSESPMSYDELENYYGRDFSDMDEDEIIEYLKSEHGYTDEDLEDEDDPWDLASELYELPEVYEWWLCSGWLINRLSEYGEVVHEDMGIWGRCTTGQSIYMDGVMSQIARDLLVKYNN